MLNFDAMRDALTEICNRYEKTAPTVHAWANDLYIRLGTKPDDVRLSELLLMEDLASGEIGPNLSANQVYKLMHRLGRDTTGHAGF